jgi:Spy/CpxP family protein refolding chaperone
MKNSKTGQFKPMVIVGTCIALMLSSNVYSNDVQSIPEQGKAKHHHMKKGHKLKGMMKALKLSDQQKEQMKAIKQNARSENEALLVQMKEFKDKRKSIVNSDELNEAEFIALLNEYQSVRSQLMLNKAKNKHAMRQVLTEEQREKMNSYKQKRARKLSL